MEAQIGTGRSCHYGSGAELELNLGKRSYEWDLNNWNWDGELFLARPTNGNGIRIANGNGNGNIIASNSSSSYSEENEALTVGAGQSQTEAEKRRRVVVVEEENGLGSLSLQVGANPVAANGNGFVANAEERDAKKGKVVVQGGSSTRPTCQVEGCGADLTGSKDYHRRHKVCEMHAKATTAVVGNAVQRFCQQCSRFHLLEEFDEGKRSCRRRLAGHNKRRRKTQPDAAATLGGVAALDEKTTSYLIISLLRILTGLHSSNTEQPKEQDLTTNLLRNLISLAGSSDIRSLLGLLQPQSQSQSPEKAGTSAGPSSDAVTNHMPPAEVERSALLASRVVHSNGSPEERNSVSVAMNGNRVSTIPEPAVGQARLRDFDLNDVCNDVEEAENGAQTTVTVACNGNGFPRYPAWMTREPQQQSPQQTNGNSDSLSAQSLSSSNGDAQCRTDRIVFKLFGKDPHDFPIDLRTQIFDWLNNTPTDVESYIKPGCVILTIYLRLPESTWTELCNDLSGEIERLLSSCTDDFWQTGWIYVRVQHEIVFIYDGQVIVDATVPVGGRDYSKVLCVRPVAVPYSSNVEFAVKGFNLAKESMRLFCSFDGRQLFEDNSRTLAIQRHDSETQHGGTDHLVTLSFSCSTLNTRGRGFIEVEEHGFSNNFFPFIVAEKEVCSEIRTLEEAVDVPTLESSIPRDEAFKFLNELGWLLRKSHNPFFSNSSQLGQGAFQLTRFEWLVQFAINRDWCHVVRMLLDVLFTGTVDLGGKESPREVAVSMNLLLDAVRRNCRGMVETLLRYSFNGEGYIFKPDAPGPLKLTPLHTAASRSGAEGVIDALTNDPNMVGLKAWKTVQDANNQTPEDYARERHFDSYRLLVQKKLDQHENPHVVVGIPKVICKGSTFGISGKAVVPPPRQYCNLCTRQVQYPTTLTRTFLYRPALLTMVGIAAVCVCVGIFLHTLPKVRYVVRSFRWDLVDYGAI
ncbi:Squamosa promoter-binding-like protein 6 [Rhynchospora pubera]|uniref:Squamosa promoter-binding-like protein 6 n=1 Tax=Rhynchospora pubera TaxID=906938 RepID=A0AAV8CCM0_9POAL|nr:Squamosa promoter-binding-like protein 6 [Rhynchospora pubera]KAJ4795405.1 Squamosa promoter-binding-like protein 6 [Rhynchospora pubera]